MLCFHTEQEQQTKYNKHQENHDIHKLDNAFQKDACDAITSIVNCKLGAQHIVQLYHHCKVRDERYPQDKTCAAAVIQTRLEYCTVVLCSVSRGYSI